MRLFLYGVLMEQVAEWPFLSGIGPGEPATVTGRLFAVEDAHGWYPALTHGSGEVHGLLHEAGTVDLAAVDAFEGSEYERAAISARTSSGIVEAQAYIWRGQVEGLESIVHGDFARWLNETGRRAFCG